MRSILAVGLAMGALGACQVASLAPLGMDLESAPASRLFDPGTLTVMTRGVSPDADLERLWEAPTAAEVPVRAARLEASLDPPVMAARLRGLADEIQYARPHLLGLQRVVQLRRQAPGDALFGGAEPAQQLEVDPLPVLLGELEARGLHYREVARVRTADVEVPLDADGAAGLEDLRVTDFDVVLARADVGVSGPRTGHYLAHREVALPGYGPVARPRGWVSLVAEVQGRRYRFVSTHLEPAPGEDGLRIQLAQASELIDSLRGEPLPVVLVGDFNTPANLGLLGAPTYRELLLAGYVDVWTRSPGNTQAMRPTQTRPSLVLVRGSRAGEPRQVGEVRAYGLGTAAAPEGLQGPWRMGQSGVVARLHLPSAARN